MGLFDLDWKVVDLNSKTIDAVGRLLQPNESLIAIGMWQSVETKTVIQKGNSKESTQRKFHVLGLTEEHLYVAKFGGGFGSPIGDSWSRQLSTFAEWNFIRHMDKKGGLLGLQFVYPPAQGLEGGDYKSPAKVSEPFREQFETVMARYKALNSSLDVAGQLSAMHQLWTEGVLTDEEFEKSKALFLGRSPDQQQVAENNLRSLKQLKDQGILSEAEFAAKKWEVLSN